MMQNPLVPRASLPHQPHSFLRGKVGILPLCRRAARALPGFLLGPTRRAEPLLTFWGWGRCYQRGPCSSRRSLSPKALHSPAGPHSFESLFCPPRPLLLQDRPEPPVPPLSLVPPPHCPLGPCYPRLSIPLTVSLINQDPPSLPLSPFSRGSPLTPLVPVTPASRLPPRCPFPYSPLLP